MASILDIRTGTAEFFGGARRVINAEVLLHLTADELSALDLTKPVTLTQGDALD